MNVALFFVRFMVFALLVFALRNLIGYIEYVSISEQYPAFDVHARAYHSTKEIHMAVRLDNDLNPFYTWFDLSPSVEPASMRLYGYGPVDDNMKNYRLRVLVVCNQHAREVVTGELCYHLIRLLQLYVRDDHFTTVLEEQTLRGVGYWVVPVVNPWGRQLVETNVSQSCQRTNARDVDLNRNFPSVHGRPHVSEHADERPGPEPFSEYETRDLMTFADYAQPHLVINVHSGGQDILLPYDGDDESIPQHYSRMMRAATHARKNLCPDCTVGQSSLVYGPADGTFVDFMMASRGTPLAYTLEMYTSNSSDCRRFFNPDSGDELARTLRAWLTIVLRLTEKISVSIKG